MKFGTQVANQAAGNERQSQPGRDQRRERSDERIGGTNGVGRVRSASQSKPLPHQAGDEHPMVPELEDRQPGEPGNCWRKTLAGTPSSPRPWTGSAQGESEGSTANRPSLREAGRRDRHRRRDSALHASIHASEAPQRALLARNRLRLLLCFPANRSRNTAVRRPRPANLRLNPRRAPVTAQSRRH